MRRLFPDHADLELEDLYAGLTLPVRGPSRPWWVALCMVASVDGAASADGVSGGLGGEADLVALSRLRAAGDVVLVGAATVREEGYGPLVGSSERRADRHARGLSKVPRLAIVTASGDLDPGSAPFTDPRQRPLVLTSRRSEPDVRDRLGEVADIVAVGEERVEPAAALDHLARLGLSRIVCEGGPRLNRQLLGAGLVDEVFLTIAPLTVAGEAPRIAQGGPEHVGHLRLESVLEHDGDLLLRYRDPQAPPVSG